MTKKAIIAEDDKFCRDWYVGLLKEIGKDEQVDMVSDGNSLVEKVSYRFFHHKKGKYKLIMTDNRMPYVNELDATKIRDYVSGLDAITKIRDFDKTTPIIFVSSDIDVWKEALERGATEYINKKSPDFKEIFKKVTSKYLDSVSKPKPLYLFP